MADPTTLTISIDRTSMSLSPLILTGHAEPTRVMSVSDYVEPAMQPRITYAPTGDGHGDMPLGWSWQESLLNFSVFLETAASESAARAAVAKVVAAVSRLSYTTTVTVAGASPETWTCRPGSVVPAGDRTTSDLQSHANVWAVSIPVYPVRSI